jgi:autotransporter adhesin
MNSTAIGHGAAATADQTTAIGQGASASAASASAFGQGAQATATNAVAIGAGSVASAPNTASFGSPGNERRLTNIAPGVNPTDAATFGQLTSVATGLQSQVDTNRVEARRGIAAAAALSPGLMPSAPGKTTLSVNTGFYQGEAGIGVGISHRLNWSTPVMLHGSYANSGGNGHIGRVGAAFEF